MRAWTVGILAVPMLAFAAGAKSAADLPRSVAAPGPAPSPAPALPNGSWPGPPHFDGSRFDPEPMRRGSFIASVPVTPNATIGFGRFNAMPKRRLGPPDMSLSPPKVRRAAVGLSLRF